MNVTKFTSVILLIVFICGCKRQNNDNTSTKNAEQIHKEILSIDTHTDSPLNLANPDFDIGKRHSYDSSRTQLDLPRMEEGNLDAVFFAVFTAQKELSPAGYQQARERAGELFSAIKEAVNEYPEMSSLATTPEDAYKIEKKEKRAIYIGVENGYPIGKDLSYVDKYYNMGARYITLCHTSNNDICDSATDTDGPEHNGLSDFGERVVQRMNQLGMIVDVSHISDEAFFDVIDQSRAPVMASHSCVRALRDHPRNLSDSMLTALKENNGVIQICLFSDYLIKPEPNPARDSAMKTLREKYDNFEDLSEERMAQARKEWNALQKKYPGELASVQDVVDHIDYVVEHIGLEHVGIGTDFDGGARVEGCKDVSEIEKITRELFKRGYTKEEIEKIWGGNFMRVFRKVIEASGKQTT
ncbi:MAG: dipeptidase [Bacteroidota bacterium]